MTNRWKNRPDGSNWGDFGPDDQVGRMNLITPEVRLAGAREIAEGRAFCLSLPLDYPGGNELFPLRKAPSFHHERRGEGHNFNYRLSAVCNCFSDVVSDDAVLLYTQYSTQWDALSHVGQMFDADGVGRPEKVYYNGYRAGTDIVGPDDADVAAGARALGIENPAAAGVQGRWVLVDLERLHGRSRAVIGHELMKAIEDQQIEVRNGDFLCLYTGFADPVLSMNKQPDGAVPCPAMPAEGEAYPALPLHAHCLFKLGIHLGELWYFAELARWLRENDRSAFFLTAPPLRLPGSVGSPLTPIATV